MKNLKVPLKNPKPDFKTFREVLEGKKKAERVHFVELLMDEEIKKYITENLLGEKWGPYSAEPREDYWKQDIIIPVAEFKEKYQEIAVLGGVDMDKLCRLPEDDLRKYVRGILENCMPERYALGSGNSIANYVPVKNYLIMLDEGMNYSCP